MAIPSQIGYDWFWNNYNTCMDWIRKHEVAYWKSQAMALKIENDDLVRMKRKRPTKKPKRNSKSKRSKVNSSENAPELEFELSSEWAQIVKESSDRREKIKKEREGRASEFVPPQDSVDLRQKEMLELYGEGSCKILGMETVMNLEFERYIDRNSPEYWPPLALNLSAI